MKNSLPSELSENTVLDEIQDGESNGGDRPFFDWSNYDQVMHKN